jgi:hypothetical protein
MASNGDTVPLPFWGGNFVKMGLKTHGLLKHIREIHNVIFTEKCAGIILGKSEIWFKTIPLKTFKDSVGGLRNILNKYFV